MRGWVGMPIESGIACTHMCRNEYCPGIVLYGNVEHRQLCLMELMAAVSQSDLLNGSTVYCKRYNHIILTVGSTLKTLLF